MNTLMICRLAAAALIIFCAGRLHAKHPCCDVCQARCHQRQLVKKTIRVPCQVVETRMKSCVVEKIEEREETYTEFKRVPVTKTYNKVTCYLDDEVKTKEITEKKCKRVTVPVEVEYSVNIPIKEIREGVRRTSRCTECGEICVEEPCQCEVTRLARGRHTKCSERTQVVFETTKKQIDYCVKVPKKHEEFCFSESYYKLEPVEKTRTVQVCVPEIVKRPVEVETTKMLPAVIYCCEKCRHKPHAELAQHWRERENRGKFQEKLQDKRGNLQEHQQLTRDKREKKRELRQDKRDKLRGKLQEKHGKLHGKHGDK